MLYKNEQAARLKHPLYFAHAFFNIRSAKKQRGDHGIKLPFCKRHVLNTATIKRKILPGPTFKLGGALAIQPGQAAYFCRIIISEGSVQNFSHILQQPVGKAWFRIEPRKL